MPTTPQKPSNQTAGSKQEKIDSTRRPPSPTTYEASPLSPAAEAAIDRELEESL